jgi:hypothetical protein
MVEPPLILAPPLSLHGSVPSDAELRCRREFVKVANALSYLRDFAETGTKEGKPFAMSSAHQVPVNLKHEN